MTQTRFGSSMHTCVAWTKAEEESLVAFLETGNISIVTQSEPYLCESQLGVGTS